MDFPLPGSPIAVFVVPCTLLQKPATATQKSCNLAIRVVAKPTKDDRPFVLGRSKGANLMARCRTGAEGYGWQHLRWSSGCIWKFGSFSSSWVSSSPALLASQGTSEPQGGFFIFLFQPANQKQSVGDIPNSPEPSGTLRNP